jgi:acetolactate synthase-1/2/3 large subunit
MDRMTGGEAIVGALEAHGVDTLFGLPGAQTYGLFDALARSNRIRVVCTRHEQACSYMAFGYSRATGRPGVFSVVPGPGILNAGAGMVSSFGGNEQVLCLTGQVPGAFLGKGHGHLHELPDQLATLRGLVKWADRIDHPGAAPDLVARAFQEMASLRPGPAALEMPWEQFTTKAPVVPVEPLERRPDPLPDEEPIAKAAGIIAKAKAPMIFVGSGAIEAEEQVGALARRIGAPVMGFRSGRGIVSEADPLGMNVAQAWELWAKTDVLIGIGTRLEVSHWRWATRPADLKTIRIDIDAAELRRGPGDVDVLARSGTAIDALIAELDRIGAGRADRGEAIAAAKAKADEEIKDIRPHYEFLRAIRDVLPEDGVVTDELCQAGFASWYAFPVYKPRTYVSTGYQQSLGGGFPTALGAKVARPDVPVVCIAGDGGFMFGVQELATAAQYGIGVTVLVFNNNAFGNVQRDQETRFEGRVIASTLKNPDFMKVADAFGVEGTRVKTAEELRGALERSFAHGRCSLIEIPLELKDEVSPWRFIHRGWAY